MRKGVVKRSPGKRIGDGVVLVYIPGEDGLVDGGGLRHVLCDVEDGSVVHVDKLREVVVNVQDVHRNIV